MAALFESATSGGLFLDAASSGAYGSDLDFDYLLSQVGIFGSPSSDDSFYSSTLLEDKSARGAELSWHVEWFDSSNDIVDLASYDSTSADDDLKQPLPPATNGGSTQQNIKQTSATVPVPPESSQEIKDADRASEIKRTSEASFNNKAPTPAIEDFLLVDLTPEELRFYTDAFLSSNVEQPSATISPSLLLAPLTPPPSSPLTTSNFTLTTPAQNRKDTATMDYSFLSPSDLYVPDNQFGYPLTPGYMDNSAYVIDMAKSQSEPSFPEPAPKKRRRVPQALNLSSPISNKRKRTDDDDDMPVHNVPQEQYKRPRLQSQYHSVDDIHVYTSTPTTATYQAMTMPVAEPQYQFQSEFSPYETLMSCYDNQNQIPYQEYIVPATPYQMPFQEGFHTPPISPFESMGWYAPQRPYIPTKTQQAAWNTPRTVPPLAQYPISPTPTPKKKHDFRRLPLAPAGPRQSGYPLSPPNSAPPYPVTQQHLLPKLDPHDAGLPITPTKKEGKKGGKKNAGGGMFINYTADDRETILSGVAPSGSSKAKKDKKEM